MAYIIPNEGDNHILSAAFQCSGNFLIRLFTANPTLTADMTIASLQEMTGGGYSGMPIIASAWCVPYFTAGSAEVSASGDDPNGFKFDFSAAVSQTAFGYVITNAANKIVAVETFASSYYLGNSGDTLTIKPKIRAT